MEFTALIEKSEDGWYVGQIQEVPSAISQAKTIEELKVNLLSALRLIFDSNKEQLSEVYAEKEVITERIKLAS